MLLDFMTNVKEIWCGQPQSGSFCNLGTLNISNCDSLQHVFTPYMAKYLVHLHTLDIDDCQSLKEVVAAETDKDVEEEYSSSILCKLKSVKLNGLPALERFCHFAKDLEFRELYDVYVAGCPEFKAFAPGFVHTPILHYVKIEYGPKTLWKENLNNTVQHLYEYLQEEEEEDSEEEEYSEEEEDSEEEGEGEEEEDSEEEEYNEEGGEEEEDSEEEEEEEDYEALQQRSR